MNDSETGLWGGRLDVLRDEVGQVDRLKTDFSGKTLKDMLNTLDCILKHWRTTEVI